MSLILSTLLQGGNLHWEKSVEIVEVSLKGRLGSLAVVLGRGDFKVMCPLVFAKYVFDK